MSLYFEEAPYCKSKRCTNLLMAESEYRAGYCYLCECDNKLAEKKNRFMQKLTVIFIFFMLTTIILAEVLK